MANEWSRAHLTRSIGAAEWAADAAQAAADCRAAVRRVAEEIREISDAVAIDAAASLSELAQASREIDERVDLRRHLILRAQSLEAAAAEWAAAAACIAGDARERARIAREREEGE
jgi:hypothetical protein